MDQALERQVALIVGLTAMSLTFVILRMIARFRTKVHLGMDDYLILACAALNFPYLGVALWGTWPYMYHAVGLQSCH